MIARIAASSLVAVSLSAPCAAVAQETFRTEAALSYQQFKASDVRNRTAGAEATYFFEALPARPDYPLEQTQFVERSGSVGATYSRSRSDITGEERLSDGSSYGANILFARPDLPLIVLAGYQSSKSGKVRTSGSQVELEAEASTYRASLGAYLAKTTDLLLNWSRSTTDAKNNVGPTTTSTLTTVGLSGEHLMRLPGSAYIALTASAAQNTLERQNVPDEKNHDYILQATYYPTRMLGVTAGVSVNRGDDTFAEGEAYSAGVRTFFTPALSLSVDYQKFNAKTAGNDFDIIAVRAAMRF